MSDSAAEGFSVLDGVALVAGAAVASVHARSTFGESFFGPGWVVAFGVFLWVGVTAAGPFLYLVRRHARKSAGYPRFGDAALGHAGDTLAGGRALQSAPSQTADAHARTLSISSLVLFWGIVAVSMVALAVVWKTWVAVEPEQASRNFDGPWTNRVGLVLAIAWPIQCGLGMVVAG